LLIDIIMDSQVPILFSGFQSLMIIVYLDV
jgi:hypothetical protein